MQHVLGLDIGTTSLRAMLFDPKLDCVARATAESPLQYPQAGWVQQDANQLWDACLSLLTTIARSDQSQNIASLGLTNQRESIVVWERSSGRAVLPSINWQCRRSVSICERLAPQAEMIRSKTGLPLDAYFSATKLMWLFENHPELRVRADKGELAVGTIDSWVIWNLTRGHVHATDVSNASRTMLFNIYSEAYDQELLDLMDIPISVLPKVMSSDSCFGTIAQGLPLEGLAIRAVLGDQQASLFAQSAGQPNVIKSTYGTGLFVMAQTGDNVATSDQLVSTVAWKVKEQTTYALEGSIFTGGSLIQWLRDQLKLISTSEESEALANDVTDNAGVYVVPAWQGLGAPFWSDAMRGLIAGLGPASDQRHIVRAALESLAYQVRAVVDAFQQADPQAKWQELCVDGGACANNFLMQWQADLLQMVVKRPQQLESTALGVVALAGIASNVWDLETFRSYYRIETIFEPCTKMTEQAEMSYQTWLSYVNKNLI